MKTILKNYKQITIIAVVAIGIGALVTPGSNLIPTAAYAHGSHHHNHHHHHHHSHVKVKQALTQINACDHSACANEGSNNADVHVGHHGSTSVRVNQELDQANGCTGGSLCTNLGSNNATIH